jgi:hypothetical protein
MFQIPLARNVKKGKSYNGVITAVTDVQSSILILTTTTEVESLTLMIGIGRRKSQFAYQDGH